MNDLATRYFGRGSARTPIQGATADRLKNIFRNFRQPRPPERGLRLNSNQIYRHSGGIRTFARQLIGSAAIGCDRPHIFWAVGWTAVKCPNLAGNQHELAIRQADSLYGMSFAADVGPPVESP
jgi:hypothetical protein